MTMERTVYVFTQTAMAGHWANRSRLRTLKILLSVKALVSISSAKQNRSGRRATWPVGN